jgi:hypothetical protein
MVKARSVARLGVLAVGLGFGAAMAHSPGLAAADSSSDWASSIDGLLSGALPAPATSGLDLAISFDGYSLFQEGNAAAITDPGQYGLAIAVGEDAVARATGGTGDYALADGTGAQAVAGGQIVGDSGANYDTAIDIGSNTDEGDGAYAGDADIVGNNSGGTGSYDTAIDIGNNTNGSSDGAFAGAGGLSQGTGDGNNDTAIDFGNNSGVNDAAFATEGNGNYASLSGSTSGVDEYAYAGEGNDNTVVADTSYTTNYSTDDAASGNDNYAYVLGPDNSTAVADGDSNIANVMDPFGSTADHAFANGGFMSDLAAVLFTDGTATANTADGLYDILTAFGPETGMF